MGNSQGGNGFSWSTTAEQAARDVDLRKKNIIVTGGGAGIGLETARVLALHGANVVIACRDVEKAKKAIESLSLPPTTTIEALPLDLSSLSSVRRFAALFKSKNIPLNILINNAGVMDGPYQKTEDGYEMQFATNHLGHFLLSNLLLDELTRGAPSRVVCVASETHEMFRGTMKWDDLQSEKSYNGLQVYGMTKTANILFAVEFTRRFQDRDIFANSLHPGRVTTGLVKNNNMLKFLFFAGSYVGAIKNPQQGAATSVYLATAEELAKIGGKYFVDCNLATPAPYAVDPEDAIRLWDISATLVGLD